MSQFKNTNDLFLEPKTTQYGSHMIMTNVTKQTKTKYINIDTRFRDEYNYLQIANYNITLPERIADVSKMTVKSVEIPISFHNISSNIGNNCFNVTISGTTTKITIPDGNYNTTSLTSALNTALTGYNLTYNNSSSKSTLTSTSGTVTVNFAIGSTGGSDKYNFKSKLGWLMGFRNSTYSITSTITTSESFIDLNGPRYLYLAIDEFNKGNQHSFYSPLYTSIINKNIIARISLDPSNHSFGSVLPVNYSNGLLLSDTRSYTGKIDLLKLNVQLLDENGNNIALNGLDFSFCLEVEHE